MSNIAIPQFDRRAHRYTVGGVVYPSVTTVAKVLSPDMHFGIPKQVLERKRDIGNAVHAACELHDRGQLGDLGPDAATIEPYLNAWIKFRRENPSEWDLIEQPLAHTQYGFAGTQDRSGLVALAGNRRAKRSLVDIKTVLAIHPIHGVQLSGYELLEEDKIEQRLAVQLRKDGTYSVHPFGCERTTFLSALNAWKWRERHGII